MNIKQIYTESNALLNGHFVLASGKHSSNYLQSAKILEYPHLASQLTDNLAKIIKNAGIEVDTVCSPAIGGILAGYELARSLNTRSIFVEKNNGTMVLRRGFHIKKGEKIIVCEDIITTGGSALKAAEAIEELGGVVVAFASLASRGICHREGGETESKPECKLPKDIPFFSLGDFIFETFDPVDCPMCKSGVSTAIKAGS